MRLCYVYALHELALAGNVSLGPELSECTLQFLNLLIGSCDIQISITHVKLNCIRGMVTRMVTRPDMWDPYVSTISFLQSCSPCRRRRHRPL